MPPPENLDRVLSSLENSVRSSLQLANQMTEMRQRFDSLKEQLGQKMEGLEQEMDTMNAHLDNLVREQQVTNQLLRSESDRRTQIEKEEKERKKQLEERNERDRLDKRQMFKVAVTEIWSIVKGPLAWLVALAIAFLGYRYLAAGTLSLPG